MSNSHQQRAFAAAQLGQYDLARREATAALAANPDDQMSRLILGEASMRLGEYAAGREQALELLRIAPNWGWGHWLLAWCWLLDNSPEVFRAQQTARLKRAKAAANDAILCDPTEPAFFEVAASIVMQIGDHKSAMQLIDAGLQNAPDCQYLQRLKGDVFSAVREPCRATAAFRESLKLQPEDDLSHRKLARELFANGEYLAASEHIRQAIRLEPNDEETRQLLLAISQTQHWLLRGVIWLHQQTRLIRVWFPLWVFITAMAGLPIVVWAEFPGRPRWVVYVAYSLWMLVVWFPLESLVMPQLADMLWVLLGRDAERRRLSTQERWDRLAPGVFLLSIMPVAIASVAFQSSAIPSLCAMFTVLALLQSGAAARASRLWTIVACVAAGIYLWASSIMLSQNITVSDRAIDMLFKFHTYSLIGALVWRGTAHHKQ